MPLRVKVTYTPTLNLRIRLCYGTIDYFTGSMHLGYNRFYRILLFLALVFFQSQFFLYVLAVVLARCFYNSIMYKFLWM